MRRLGLVLAAAAALAVATPRLFAGDAPAGAAPEEERAKVARLVEELGSADFRVREAATKALTAMGEKARAALEEAVKSPNPAVRFRADQILQGLDGTRGERPLDDGTTTGRDRPPRARLPRAWTDGRFEEQMREMERRIRELHEQWTRDFGQGRTPGFGFGFEDGDGVLRLWPGLRGLRGAGDLHVSAETDAATLAASEGPRGARIEIRSKSDRALVSTFSGRTVDAVLDGNPGLRERPGVGDLLARLDAARKERAERAKEAPSAGAVVQGRSVTVESSDGGTKVTITTTGPDGRAVTKTFEGNDLESIKAAHPEVREALGGMSIRVGPNVRMPRFRLDDDEDDDLDDDADEDDDLDEAPRTGPFGLALEAVDEATRARLGLAPGAGVRVVVVRDGSDAAKVGLRAGDVIVAVKGKPVLAFDDLVTAIRGAGADGPLSFDVRRDGTTVALRR